MLKSLYERYLAWRVLAASRTVRRRLDREQALDLELELQLQARRSSADYAAARMGRARAFEDRLELLAHALSAAPKEGLVLEFGVYKGESVNFIAERAARVHGFDSFEGLPEDWRTGYEKGSFKQGPPPVRSNVELHAGWFDKTLPAFLASHPEDAAFVHVDCDLYSSAKTVLEALAPRLKAGTVLVFDEYFNYPSWQEHEFKAFQELASARALRYEYLAYHKRGEQVSLRLL